MRERIDRLTQYLPLVVVALVLAIVVYVRIRLLAVPLERDEGEFAYMGQLLLKGIPPFSHAYTMKLPGVSVMYALIMLLFGQTPFGIHMGLLIVNGVCVYLVYLLSQRLFDRQTALFSCASYAALSLSISVFGVFAHATHFVMLFTLTGFLLLLRYIENHKFSFLLLSGLCFGLAFLMKQHAIMFMLFAVLYLSFRLWKNCDFFNKSITGIILFLLGMVIPYVTIIVWMVYAGSFTDFWFWTVRYAGEYTSTLSLAMGWHEFKYSFDNITSTHMPLCLFALAGAVFLGINKRSCTDRLFVYGFLLFSFLAICPGLYFREHYFVLLLPAVAMLSGAGMNSVGLLLSSSSNMGRLAPFITPSLLVIAVGYNFNYERKTYFILTPTEVCRSVFGENPFPEALQIADYLKNNTSPDENIAVLGSEPEIFFYANRLSATGHIYMYGLMEEQPYAERMQMAMAREIEAARPVYVVFVNVDYSWLPDEHSNREVLGWRERYIRSQYDRYDRVGVIDIIDPRTTHYLWGPKALEYSPASKCSITVFKRKIGV